MDGTRRIQRTKLLPPSPGKWELPRHRLLALLAEGHEAPLSIICGMAGSGKTTLARQWSSELDASAWIALDSGDDELNRFVSLLVNAMQSIQPAFGMATLSDLTLGRSLAPEDLATTFTDEIAQSRQSFTIVLDDLHLINTPAIYEFLSWVFHYPPPEFHLCLVTRSDPPLPLTRYRARYRLAEIRLAQLLLTIDETRQFWARTGGTPMPATALAQLHEQTEGWITGLHLTALAVRRTEPDGVLQLPRHQATQASMAYLAEQILADQPEAISRQLLLLAIPEQVNVELAWHLLNAEDQTTSIGELLQTLEANGYFLSSLGMTMSGIDFTLSFGTPCWKPASVASAQRRSRLGTGAPPNGLRNIAKSARPCAIFWPPEITSLRLPS